MKAIANQSAAANQPEVAARCARWLDEHGDALLRYAAIRVGRIEVAEDLVQEAFLSALEAIDRFNGRSSIRTWLIGILRHKIVDFHRRESRRPIVRQANPSSTDAANQLFNARGFWREKPGEWPDSPSGALENQEFWRVFEECRTKLTPAIAAVFMMREIDQLSTEAICSELKISRSSFSVRMHRARAALRDCLERNWFSK